MESNKTVISQKKKACAYFFWQEKKKTKQQKFFSHSFSFPNVLFLFETHLSDVLFSLGFSKIEAKDFNNTKKYVL